jgi:RNA polymerase sigma factor (sigma-70 family)
MVERARQPTLGARRLATEDIAASFEIFYEAEHDGLFAALHLITRNSHEAEELMHEAFLKLWERWERVREMGSPTGYLYRTAMNAFRARHRRAAMSRRLLGWAYKRDPLEEVESRDALDRALAALTVRQRAAVILTELLDYTSEEAGRLLGVRPGTVRVLAQHGRDTLRNTMEKPS